MGKRTALVVTAVLVIAAVAVAIWLAGGRPGGALRKAIAELRAGGGLGSYEPFPDEAKAMAAYEAGPSEEALDAVVAIRVAHAMELAGRFSQSEDIEAYKRALAYAENSAGLVPENARVLFTAGYLYSWAASASEPAAEAAEQYLTKALDLEPLLTEARATLGAVYYDTARYDDALAEWERVVGESLGAPLPTVYDGLCDAYQLGQQLERGEQFLREIVAQHPASDAARLSLAQVLRARQGPEREIRSLVQSVADNPRALKADQWRARRFLDLWFKGEGRP